nr:uncharacterized protein LOC109402851 [Aedes albopictus]
MKTRNQTQKGTKRKAPSPSAQTEIPIKRPRKDARQEGSVQFVSRLLRDVQNDAGHPVAVAMGSYAHSNILQLPFQPGILTQDTIYRHYEEPSWNFTYPVPLVTQFSNPGTAVEPMLRLVKAKKKHLTTLAHMKLLYAKKKSIYKKACKGFVGKLFPNMLYKVAEEMERDPDKWFQETYGYDYYFTGGSLAVVGGREAYPGHPKWIITTVGENMNAIEMARLNLTENRATIDRNQLKLFELSEKDGPIYEICTSVVEKEDDDDDSSSQNLRIVLRRKRKIELLCGEGESIFSSSKTLSSEVPFISCCFLRGSSDSLICTSDLGKRLRIWNFEIGEVVQELNLSKKVRKDDCWTCVRSFGKNHFVCLDRSSIRLFKTKFLLKLVNVALLSTWLWACEKASCLEVCPEEKLLFIGTSHKLLVLQLVDRGDAQHREFQQILTFTHNLKYFPTMIRFDSDSNENFFVWLSSQLPGDTTICNFSKVPPKRFATNNLPRKPWTVQEGFDLARHKGKCIYPAAKLKRRLQLFHSGLAILVDEHDRFHLFLQTSPGDVFHQRITHATDDTLSERIPLLYHSWMLKLNREIPFVPKATDFKNLRGFKKVLSCSNLYQPEPELLEDTTFRKRPGWQQSVEDLHQYKDLLAPDILQIWGFRPDVSGRPPRRISTDQPMDVADRISHWLDTTAAVDQVPIVVGDEEGVGASRDGSPVVADEVVPIESDHDQEELLHSVVEVGEYMKPEVDACEQDVVFVRAVVSDVTTSAVNKSAAKPGRRKYVKGF